MTLSFQNFNLSDLLLDGLDTMGFNNPTPIQEQVIPHILQGADVIACAQTGTGKTAAYLLPVLDKISRDNIPHTCALIISPTRELALQIDQAFQGFSYFTHASSIAVYGGSDGITFEREKKALKEGASVVIATPGRLLSHLNMAHIQQRGAGLLLRYWNLSDKKITTAVNEILNNPRYLQKSKIIQTEFDAFNVKSRLQNAIEESLAMACPPATVAAVVA